MSNPNNNKIVKQIYYAIKIKLASPLNVSSGDNMYTDNDVLTNKKGEILIPGTSIAGAFRNSINQKKDEKGFMGYSKGEDGAMSSVFISDIYFDKNDKISNLLKVRDGVSLNEQKIVDNKFDYQIVNPGLEGVMFIHLVVREEDNEQLIENSIYRFILDMEEGYVRFGANKNRGMGRVCIEDVRYESFTKDNAIALLAFKADAKDIEKYTNTLSFSEMKEKLNDVNLKKDDAYSKIRIPLSLQGGISIRTYSTKKGAPDFEHITVESENGETVPVIPGSSWNGAIRADVKRILNELGCKKTTDYINKWFGYVDVSGKNSQKQSAQSMIVISESCIDGAVAMNSTRNKVNRFDQSTIKGALYTERAYFGGKTVLEIMIKNTCEKIDALKGVLGIVIEDIKKGYVAIGGQVAVGRGVFEIDNSEKQDDITANIWSEDKYRKALYDLLNEEEAR